MARPTQRVQANDHLEWPALAHAYTASQKKKKAVQHAWRSVASAGNVGPSGQRAASATRATHGPQLVALPCLCHVCASAQQKTKGMPAWEKHMSLRAHLNKAETAPKSVSFHNDKCGHGRWKKSSGQHWQQNKEKRQCTRSAWLLSRDMISVFI